MYSVIFKFRNEETGWAWKSDYLNNNGEGFTKEDALMIAKDFNQRDNVKDARVVKINDNEDLTLYDTFYEDMETIMH